MLIAEALINTIESPALQYTIHLVFEIVTCVIALFLILLILVQRGRGGGLAGALGGMGGQSAFGTRAGDTFTWITYITAALWILLATFTIKTFTDPHEDRIVANAKKHSGPPPTGASGLPNSDEDEAAFPSGTSNGKTTPAKSSDTEESSAKSESKSGDEDTATDKGKNDAPNSDAATETP